MTLAGLEPALVASEERRLIHQAIGPSGRDQTSTQWSWGSTERTRTTTAHKKHQEPRSGHGVVRLPCSILWLCVTGMLTAAHSSLFVGGRRCLLHVRRDRDAYALAFCSSGGFPCPYKFTGSFPESLIRGRLAGELQADC